MNQFMMPLTQVLGMLWLGLVAWAGWRAWRRQWRRLVLPASLAGLLSVLGSTSLAARLLASLERPYAGVKLADVPPAEAVVMLGGVLAPSPNDPFGFEFKDAADRVMVAVELMRLEKGRALVLGGGGPRPGESGPLEGELLKGWLASWGPTNAPLHLLGNCVDTHDEAVRVRALAKERGWPRVIVVTSAAHMRRAEGLFRKLELPVTCVACDFVGMAQLVLPRQLHPFPDQLALELINTYLHERIGWWVYRWRGWVTAGPSGEPQRQTGSE
jgi:uncharacterized SAM-binding protein YcdF (DUF218 family)